MTDGNLLAAKARSDDSGHRIIAGVDQAAGSLLVGRAGDRLAELTLDGYVILDTVVVVEVVTGDVR